MIELVGPFDRLGLRREWEDLAERSGAPPFLRPGWIETWWRAFGTGNLEILSIRSGGRLRALMPLQAFPGSVKTPTNWQTPLFGAVAEDAEASAELARALLERGSPRVELAFADRDDPLVSSLGEAAEAAGFRVATRTLLRSPFLAVQGDWQTYCNGIARKRMSDIARRTRRLEEKGKLAFEVHDGTEDLSRLLQEGLRVEASGWKGQGRTAIVARPDTNRFYRELALWAAPRGWLRLGFLRLDGTAIAFDYCLEQDGVHYLLKTGYESTYARFGPGILIRHHMLARAFSTGLHRYEFLGTDDPWKLEWSSDTHDRVLVQAFAPTVKGSVDWAVSVPGRAAARRARRVARALFRT